jgi:sigma-B regulation protein RsbU (phosphoserine phosphatase)
MLEAIADRAALALRSAQATEQARSNEQSLRLFLSRMTRGLSSSIDTSQLIQWIADFAAEISGAAHSAVYEILGDEIQLKSAGKASRIVVEKPTLSIGEGLSGTVARQKQMLQVPDIRRDGRFVTSAASIPTDAVTYVGVPMLYKGDMVGVLAVYGLPTSYSENDLQLLGSFAGQAAAAIENARSFEHQRKIATIMQQSFLPRERLSVKGIELGLVFEPASETIGGDYYDFVTVNTTSGVVILGDVSGKGIPAATYTAMGKYVLRAYAFEDPSPPSVLRRANAALAAQVEPGIFITLFYALVDVATMTLRYANAGHPDGLLYRPSLQQCLSLPSTGLMLGALPSERYEGKSVAIQPGDLLVLYTDGVTEARNGDELFGVERLKRSISLLASQPAREIAHGIRREVAGFNSGGFSDDICIIALRILGSSNQADPSK